MEMILNNEFCALSFEEMEVCTGGGWKEFGYVFGGCVLIGMSPFVAALGGPAAAVGVFGTGVSAIGKGCH